MFSRTPSGFWGDMTGAHGYERLPGAPAHDDIAPNFKQVSSTATDTNAAGGTSGKQPGRAVAYRAKKTRCMQWLVLSATGDRQYLHLDKRQLVQFCGLDIPMRDMRLLDASLLASGSGVASAAAGAAAGGSGQLLVRDNAIIMALEHVRMIIMADKAILPLPEERNDLHAAFLASLESVLGDRYAESAAGCHHHPAAGDQGGRGVSVPVPPGAWSSHVGPGGGGGGGGGGGWGGPGSMSGGNHMNPSVLRRDSPHVASDDLARSAPAHDNGVMHTSGTPPRTAFTLKPPAAPVQPSALTSQLQPRAASMLSMAQLAVGAGADIGHDKRLPGQPPYLGAGAGGGQGGASECGRGLDGDSVGLHGSGTPPGPMSQRGPGDEQPFEMHCLEAGLGEVCTHLAREVDALQGHAMPALEDLISSSNRRNLERVRRVKTTHQRLLHRISVVQDALHRLLEDDGDMFRMCLSRTKRKVQLASQLLGAAASHRSTPPAEPRGGPSSNQIVPPPRHPSAAAVTFNGSGAGLGSASSASGSPDDASGAPAAPSSAQVVLQESPFLSASNVPPDIGPIPSFGGGLPSFSMGIPHVPAVRVSRRQSSGSQQDLVLLGGVESPYRRLSIDPLPESFAGIGSASLRSPSMLAVKLRHLANVQQQQAAVAAAAAAGMSGELMQADLPSPLPPLPGGATLTSSLRPTGAAPLGQLLDEDDVHDVLDVENLLEAYSTMSDATKATLINLGEYIDDTEDLVNINLDYSRNKIIKLELIITIGTFALAFYACVAGVLGENLVLPQLWTQNVWGFYAINAIVIMVCIAIFFGTVAAIKGRKIM